MEATSRLYNDLQELLSQSKTWADIRHLKTLVWMVIALICSECINLTKWGIYVQSRASMAQSRQRRFSRWLHNSRINVHSVYGAIICKAVKDWKQEVMVLILDTTMLWNEYCIVRVCVEYRGRAVPMGWRVLRHKSSSVSLEVYRPLLRRVSRLVPAGVEVRFLADRGFADTQLLRYLKEELGWHYRIRGKNDLWVWCGGKPPRQLKQFHLGLGEAVLLQGVKITKTDPFGLVCLALARDLLSGELWYIISDETPSLQTFREYSYRFDIEENFLDDKSNGFELERSQIRSSIALSRLCLVLSLATLYLTVQGQQVVASGLRRRVDCHWQRGNSYLRIGWQWIKGCLHQGWASFHSLQLFGTPDPEPAIASRKQAQKQYQREFTVKSYCYST